MKPIVVKDTDPNSTITCPLCGATARHAIVYTDRANVVGQIATHAWVCDECPMVMFEYYSKANTQALASMLDSEEGL